MKRSQLFLSNQNRIMLRAHDFRASFVTVSLAQGRSEAWVMDRTGHMSSQMLQKYRRLVRGHQEQNLGTFVPLSDAIPELSVLVHRFRAVTRRPSARRAAGAFCPQDTRLSEQVACPM